MSKTTTFVDRIVRIERHTGYTGRNGNPRWIVSFEAHDSAPTIVDGSVGYGINNAEYRAGRVEVTLDARGQIEHLKALDEIKITTRYFSDPNTGAGKITARVSGGELHRGRRVTVGFDHAARDPHQVAALALTERLGIPAMVEYASDTKTGSVYSVTILGRHRS